MMLISIYIIIKKESNNSNIYILKLLNNIQYIVTNL